MRYNNYHWISNTKPQIKDLWFRSFFERGRICFKVFQATDNQIKSRSAKVVLAALSFSLSWVRGDRVKFLRPARDIPWPALLSRESRSDLVTSTCWTGSYPSLAFPVFPSLISCFRFRIQPQGPPRGHVSRDTTERTTADRKRSYQGSCLYSNDVLGLTTT